MVITEAIRQHVLKWPALAWTTAVEAHDDVHDSTRGRRGYRRHHGRLAGAS
jgi:hypothetical protein